jgi:hypothetical protein
LNAGPLSIRDDDTTSRCPHLLRAPCPQSQRLSMLYWALPYLPYSPLVLPRLGTPDSMKRSPLPLDPQGRVVSFKNTMVILTSNVGSRVIAASAANGTGLPVFGGRGPAGQQREEEDPREAAAERVGAWPGGEGGGVRRGKGQQGWALPLIGPGGRRGSSSRRRRRTRRGSRGRAVGCSGQHAR